MRRACLAILLATVAFVLTGCRSGPSLVGRWQGSFKSIPAVFEFRRDNTFSAHADASGLGVKAKATIDGTYAIDGEKLTITFTKVETHDVPAPVKALVESSFAKDKGTPHTGTISFTSQDEVKVSGEGLDTTLTRIKDAS